MVGNLGRGSGRIVKTPFGGLLPIDFGRDRCFVPQRKRSTYETDQGQKPAKPWTKNEEFRDKKARALE